MLTGSSLANAREEDFPNRIVHAEFRLYHAVVLQRPHHAGIGLGSQNQGQGSQQDGFACPRFSAYNNQTLRKRRFQRADKNIIGDGEAIQHYSSLLMSMGFSFWALR